MSMYSLTRRCYQHAVPSQLRHSIYLATPRPLKLLRRRVIQALERTAEHDEIYDADYYAKFVEPTMQLSAEAISESIQETFAPSTAADVGCGTGVLLKALEARGVDVRGYEYSEAALAMCRERGLDVAKFDIEHDSPPRDSFDLVISTEVAEHLPAHCADRFVQLLVSLAPIVVLTAATPGQGGTDHVNEQPNQYWIDHFARRSYAHDPTTSDRWRRTWKDKGIADCFASTVMIFRRA